MREGVISFLINLLSGASNSTLPATKLATGWDSSTVPSTYYA
jgi:hypothetical protein